MASSPHDSASIVNSLIIRQRQLRARLEKISERLRELDLNDRHLRSRGIQELHDSVRIELDTVSERLRDTTLDLSRLGDKGSSVRQGELKQVLTFLANADLTLSYVDANVLPIFKGRTPSDPTYDDFLANRMFAELNLAGTYPVTTHTQTCSGGLAVLTRYARNPVFFFTPTNRSFDTLALLYHEIGHHVWDHVITSNEKLQIGALINSLRIEPKGPRPGVPVIEMSSIHKEVASDLFAALVGGRAYLSSLCAFLMTKRQGGLQVDHSHPNPNWRVWLCRQAAASELGFPKKSLPPDSLIESFDDVVAMHAAKWNAPEMAHDEVAVGRLIGEFSKSLEVHRIPLGLESLAITSEGSPLPELDVSKTSIQQILISATCAKTKNRFSELYVDWERATFRRFGFSRKRFIDRFRFYRWFK